MEIFNMIWTELTKVLYFDYILAVVLTTYLLIKYVFPNNYSDRKRAFINFIVGIVYGILFYVVGEKMLHFIYSPLNILISMLTTVTIYQWFISWLLKKIGIGYKSTDPELFGKKTEKSE